MLCVILCEYAIGTGVLTGGETISNKSCLFLKFTAAIRTLCTQDQCHYKHKPCRERFPVGLFSTLVHELNIECGAPSGHLHSL